MKPHPPRLLTAEDVRDHLQVSLSQAYALMHEMPHVHLGRSIRVTEKALEA